MRAGVPRRFLQILSVALLDPQQAREPREVRLALAAPGQLETQQRGQRVLGFFAVQAPRAVVDQQLAAGAGQELLFQHIAVAGVRERELDAGARAGFAMRRQVGHLAGAVALQEG
ncbi:hypothetical protein D9M68_653000 [compost metagenome]